MAYTQSDNIQIKVLALPALLLESSNSYESGTTIREDVVMV